MRFGLRAVSVGTVANVVVKGSAVPTRDAPVVGVPTVSLMAVRGSTPSP